MRKRDWFTLVFLFLIISSSYFLTIHSFLRNIPNGSDSLAEDNKSILFSQNHWEWSSVETISTSNANFVTDPASTIDIIGHFHIVWRDYINDRNLICYKKWDTITFMDLRSTDSLTLQQHHETAHNDIEEKA